MQPYRQACFYYNPQAATQSLWSTCGGETLNPLLQWSLPALVKWPHFLSLQSSSGNRHKNLPAWFIYTSLCTSSPLLLCLPQVPGHSGSEILQPGAVLHHTSGNLPGLPVHLQPHSQAPRHPLLPPAAGNRPVTRYELLCARHQSKELICWWCGG